MLDTNIGQAMDVLADIVLHATFEKREMEKEKLVVIEELKNAEDDPEDIIHDYFERSIFPEHSLGFPIIGTEENVRRFNGTSPVARRGPLTSLPDGRFGGRARRP